MAHPSSSVPPTQRNIGIQTQQGHRLRETHQGGVWLESCGKQRKGKGEDKNSPGEKKEKGLGSRREGSRGVGVAASWAKQELGRCV